MALAARCLLSTDHWALCNFNHSAFSYQLEVSQLEGSLQQPKAQSAMSPYLIPDTQALCYHLPVIRQLATSGRFIIIIPRTGELTGRLGTESAYRNQIRD